MKSSLRFSAFLLVAALALSACAPKSPASRPIIIIASDQPASADPAENWAFGGAAYLPQVYDTLFRFAGDQSPKLVPQLASEVPSAENGGISSDGLVYTIKLKPNAKFHDGSPVDADAVIYSYQRIKALNLGANGITADWVDKLEKVDNQTVKFTLKQPFADFLNSMGSVWGNYIVNPKVTKAHEANQDWGHAWLLDHDAGSGPYLLSSFDHANSTITLDRYADYWAGWGDNKTPIEKAIIRWLPEASSARALLEKGDADIAVNLPTADFLAMQKAAGFTSQLHPSIMQYYFSLNGSVKPLDDPRVRQALQYTLNVDKVIADIFSGNVIKMKAAVGPGYPDVYPAKTQYNFDLDQAKALLQQAGASNLELTVNVMGFWPNDEAVAEFWQADLAKIGVKLNIQHVDGGTWSKAWFDDCSASSAPNIGQISAMGVGGDYPSAWEVMAQVYPTPRLGGGKCAADYINDPKINELWNQIANTTDAAQRQALFQSLYDQIANSAGTLWIGQAADLVTMRNVVQGYQYSFAMGGNYVPLAQISLTK